MAIVRKYADTPNTSWAYIDFGDKHNPPIFLIHGGLNYADYYISLGELLSQEYYVVAPDLPGSGMTLPLKNNTYHNIAQELVYFAKALGYKQAEFFGTSLGGAVLSELSRIEPDLVKKMFLHSPYWREGCIKLGPLEKAEMSLGSAPVFVLDFLQKPAIVKMIFKFVLAFRPDMRGLLTRHGEKIIESLCLLDPKSNQVFMKSLLGIDLSANLAQLYIPVVLIAGDHDYTIPPNMTEKLSAKIRSSKFVLVENEDHEIVLDAPDKLYKIIINTH